MSNIGNTSRVRAHKVGAMNRNILDVAVMRVPVAPNAALNAESLPALIARIENTTGAKMGTAVPFSSWTSFLACLTMDGIGVSSRYFNLLLSPVLVVKQTSPFREWFGHMLQPRVVAVKNNVEDLPDAARQVLRQWKMSPEDLISKAAEAYGIMQFVGTPLAMVESMAYALTLWAKKQEWSTNFSDSDSKHHYAEVAVLKSAVPPKLRNFSKEFVTAFLSTVD